SPAPGRTPAAATMLRGASSNDQSLSGKEQWGRGGRGPPRDLSRARRHAGITCPTAWGSKPESKTGAEVDRERGSGPEREGGAKEGHAPGALPAKGVPEPTSPCRFLPLGPGGEQRPP